MGTRLKLLATTSVLGWVVAVPILVTALVDPFVSFKHWPGDFLSGSRAESAQLADVGPRDSPAPIRRPRPAPGGGAAAAPFPATPLSPGIGAAPDRGARRGAGERPGTRRRRERDGSRRERPGSSTPVAPAPGPVGSPVSSPATTAPAEPPPPSPSPSPDADRPADDGRPGAGGRERSRRRTGRPAKPGREGAASAPDRRDAGLPADGPGGHQPQPPGDGGPDKGPDGSPEGAHGPGKEKDKTKEMEGEKAKGKDPGAG